MQRTPTEIYFDGACPGSSGLMSTMVVVGERKFFQQLGIGTGNRAEWHAAKAALETGLKEGYSDVRLIGDSLLVVRQITNAAQCADPDLKKVMSACKRLIRKYQKVDWSHIERALNPAGKAMEHEQRARKRLVKLLSPAITF